LKEIIIRKQNTFLNGVWSILLSGFIDNHDNVPMYMVDQEELEDLKIAIKNGTTDEFNSKDYVDGFEAVGVTDFLKNYIISGDETQLFEKVYPPVDGKREVIVNSHHFAEALDFVEVYNGEIARKMNETAISLVFEDPKRALRERNNTPWEPHQRYKGLYADYQKMVDSTPNNSKRYRNDTTHNNGGNKQYRQNYNSYANATKNYNQ
jgi:hypothetical protein